MLSVLCMFTCFSLYIVFAHGFHFGKEKPFNLIHNYTRKVVKQEVCFWKGVLQILKKIPDFDILLKSTLINKNKIKSFLCSTLIDSNTAQKAFNLVLIDEGRFYQDFKIWIPFENYIQKLPLLLFFCHGSLIWTLMIYPFDHLDQQKPKTKNQIVLQITFWLCYTLKTNKLFFTLLFSCPPPTLFKLYKNVI